MSDTLERAASAASQAARSYGSPVSWVASRKIAEAVLATSDGELHVEEAVAAELWDNEEDYRRFVRAQLARSLAAQLTDKQLLPVTLPVEVVLPGDFGLKLVRLSVPVRRPL